MILLVDMEHPREIQRGAPCAQTGEDPRAAREAYVQDIRRRLEDCSGDRCVARPYREVNERWLKSEGPAALILSGNVADWDDYDPAELEPLKHVVRAASLPILGLCGGLQFIALAHGVEVGPIRPLADGESDVGAEFGGGYLKEWGYTAVDVLVDDDPVFGRLTGRDRPPVFLEAHYCEAKEVPDGFELLASTPTSQVQAIRRSGTMVYGTQFHPEAYIVDPGDDQNCLIRHVYPEGYPAREPDGHQFLTSFFRAAGIRR